MSVCPGLWSLVGTWGVPANGYVVSFGSDANVMKLAIAVVVLDLG